MPRTVFERLRDYYLKVAEVLRGDADAASVFPNPTDVGMSRERVYADFLKQHAPSKCNVFLGGFLFDEDGAESRQMDVIVTTDTAPRFDFHNRAGEGKSFSPVEGTLGVASIKSHLDRAQLFDALDAIASIPPTRSLEGRVTAGTEILRYDDWPYKIVYATGGLQDETILGHLDTYYSEHPEVPFTRRPHIIHVAGCYAIIRVVGGMSIRSVSEGTNEQPPLENEQSPLGTFRLMTRNPDLQGIVWVLHNLQDNAAASTDIYFSYGNLINKVNAV
jgi:hypothetical protein